MMMNCLAPTTSPVCRCQCTCQGREEEGDTRERKKDGDKLEMEEKDIEGRGKEERRWEDKPRYFETFLRSIQNNFCINNGNTRQYSKSEGKGS